MTVEIETEVTGDVWAADVRTKVFSVLSFGDTKEEAIANAAELVVAKLLVKLDMSDEIKVATSHSESRGGWTAAVRTSALDTFSTIYETEDEAKVAALKLMIETLLLLVDERGE